MDIFNYAMQMEKDGEALYRELAEKSNNKGVATVLTRLADAEVKHYQYLKMLSENTSFEFAVTDVITEAGNIFSDMQQAEKVDVLNKSQMDLYEKALEIENRSREFYLEKRDEAKDSFQKTILDHIASEEKQHARLISSILDFIKEPQRWLENAEWYKPQA